MRAVRHARAPARRRGQAGMGTLELALAAFLGFALLGTGGMLFKHQVHEYLDIREQARVQAGLKLALQSMTLEMANAGALLPNPRESFAAQAGRFSFAYMDLTGRSCPEGAKAMVAFRAATSGQTDRIVEDITCNGRFLRTQTLVSAPRGKLKLAFRYYDKRGAPTANAAQVKALDLDISLQTAGPKAGKTFAKTRAQTVHVQCVNL